VTLVRYLDIFYAKEYMASGGFEPYLQFAPYKK